MCKKIKATEHKSSVAFGAGNGNRTRAVGLGSRSSATKLYLRFGYNYIILNILASRVKNQPSDEFLGKFK